MSSATHGVSLEARALDKHFGGLHAVARVSVATAPGELHAVIGPNGAGKTTLIHLLSGFLTPDRGHIVFNGDDVTALNASQRARRGLVRTFQITNLIREFSVIENVMLAVQARQGHSFRFWKPVLQEQALLEPAKAALAQVGLESRAGERAGILAHGEQRKLELAVALATQPSFLLLDEPLAGMGSEDTQGLIHMLETLKGDYSILLIEHDLDAVFALADRITVLVHGQTMASGTPDEIRNNSEVRAAYLGDGDA